MRRRYWSFPHPDAQTLAWVAYLDVDLEAAQAAFRLPADQRGWPPGTDQPPPELASEPAAAPAGPNPESLVAPPGHALRGAYARRARC